jgi:sugar lactone lactonase YvrE
MAPEIRVNACLNHGSMKSTGRYFAVFGPAIVSLAALGASAPTEVMIHEEKPFPESLSSTSEGTLYIGSIAKSEILRSSHGAATAEPWIKPGTNGLQRVLGVLADQRSNTLWVCSSKAPQGGSPTALKTFDLKSGASKGSFDFPGDNALCNDIAIGSDGTAYATDTTAARIMRLKKGATALDVWIKDDRLAGIDGIAFGDNSTIYFNTVTTGHLFRVPVGKDGAAGDLTPIQPSQPLSRPDGMRPLAKNQFLLIEGAGRLDYVTIEGDSAKIEVLKDGFNGPTAVTQVGGTAWVLEGKLNYMNDPKLKDQDPGPFKVFPVPFHAKR